MRFLARLTSFLLRNLMRIGFVAVFLLFIASQTIMGVALGITKALASIGVETVSSVLESRAQRSAEDLEKARTKNVELEESNRKLAQKADSMEREKQLLTAELDDAKTQKKSLQASLDEAKATKKAADAEIASLRKRASGEVEFRGKKTTLKAAVADVASGVKKRTVKVAASNSASVFGEGVPVYGVAIIVATLGYELKTACDTMKDMDELQRMLDPDTASSEDVEKVCGMKVPTKEEVWQTIKDSPERAWSSAVEAYDGALSSIPTWEDIQISSADAWAWTKSAFSDAGTAIAKGASAAGETAYDAGAAAVGGVKEAGTATWKGAQELWNEDCWMFCE